MGMMQTQVTHYHKNMHLLSLCRILNWNTNINFQTEVCNNTRCKVKRLFIVTVVWLRPN